MVAVFHTGCNFLGLFRDKSCQKGQFMCVLGGLILFFGMNGTVFRLICS